MKLESLIVGAGETAYRQHPHTEVTTGRLLASRRATRFGRTDGAV
jgi:hypothetical protein